MEKGFFRNLPSIIFILVLTVSVSCSTGKYLKTEKIGKADFGGTYTLFLYGDGRAVKIAVFDIEGDDYKFELYGSKHNYVVGQGVVAEDAVKSATEFIYSQRNQWNKIMDNNGKVIGYDFRPIYHSTLYGVADILDVMYKIEDKKVIVTVDVKLSISQNYYKGLYGAD